MSAIFATCAPPYLSHRSHDELVEAYAGIEARWLAMEPIGGSFDLGYDPHREVLQIHFGGGRVYQYLGVEASIVDVLRATPSPGRLLQWCVRGYYPYFQVTPPSEEPTPGASLGCSLTVAGPPAMDPDRGLPHSMGASTGGLEDVAALLGSPDVASLSEDDLLRTVDYITKGCVPVTYRLVLEALEHPASGPTLHAELLADYPWQRLPYEVARQPDVLLYDDVVDSLLHGKWAGGALTTIAGHATGFDFAYVWHTLIDMDEPAAALRVLRARCPSPNDASLDTLGLERSDLTALLVARAPDVRRDALTYMGQLAPAAPEAAGVAA